MEGTTVTIHTKPPASDPGPLGGEGRNRSGQQRPTPPPERKICCPFLRHVLYMTCFLTLARTDTYNIDTSNILFILSGAFVGLDSILRQRLAKGVRHCLYILSCAVTHKRIDSPLDSTPPSPVPRRGDANGFVPFFTPNRKASTNILELVEPCGHCQIWVCVDHSSTNLYDDSDMFKQIYPRVHLEVTDDHFSHPTYAVRLIAHPYGCPRLPCIAIHGHYLATLGLKYALTTLALKEICRQAADRGGGARALRGIMVREIE